MSYTIYRADGTPLVVPDNAIDTVFYNANVHGPGVGVGTQLVGRNAINYGAPIAQNFLQMTENFASTSAFMPGDSFAMQGQLWFEKTSSADGVLHVRTSSATTGGAANWKSLITADSITGAIDSRGGTVPAVNPTSTLTQDGDIQVIGSTVSIYANSAWRPTGSTTTSGTLPPAVPVVGQLWFDTITNLLKVYTTSGWIEVNIGGGTTTSGTTPPATPILGELWYNTTTGALMVWTLSGWTTVNTGTQSAAAVVSGTAPTSPVQGMLWYNTTLNPATLNIYVSPSWMSVGGGGGSSATFSGPTAPPSPSVGMLWYDTTAPGTLKVYSGSAWSAVNTGGVAPPINSATAPTSPTLGQLWFDTNTMLLKTWNGTAWKEVYTQGSVIEHPIWGNQFVSNALTAITLPSFKRGSLKMFAWATGNAVSPTTPDLTIAWKYPVELIDDSNGNLVSTPTFQHPDSNGSNITGGTLPGGFILGTINYTAHTVTLSITPTTHTVNSYLLGPGGTVTPGTWQTLEWYIVPIPGPYNYNYIPT